MSEAIYTTIRYQGQWFCIGGDGDKWFFSEFPTAPKRDKHYRSARRSILDLGGFLESIVSLRRHGKVWQEEGVYNPSHAVNPHVLNTIAAYDFITFDKNIYNTALAIRNRTGVKKRPGYVYLLQSVTGHYKIGRSVDPQNRLKTFGVLLPFEVEYTCLIKTDDCVGMERYLHNMFSDFRVNGEWFQLAPDDVDYIKRLSGVTA